MRIGPVHWQGVVDFAVLAVAIYLLLGWSRQARALRLALAVVALRIATLVARQLDLVITGWVLDAASLIAVLALLVVFQPELRRAFMRLDLAGRVRRRVDEPTLAAVSAAAWTLARERLGALIVIERDDSLSELTTGGVALGGQVSADILVSIFQKGSPVHDGAALVEGGVITRVGAILPLTQRVRVPEEYGTRHRAGLGLAERSDALVIVVSEERGEVTLMWEDEARRMTSAAELADALAVLTGSRPERAGAPLPRRRRRRQRLALAAAAFALASLVWSATFLFPGRAVRVQTVPVEFTNVPAGMSVAGQSTATLQVWLRGSPFLFEAVDLGGLVAHCDLRRAHEGLNRIPVGADALDVPIGMKVESVQPHEVQVQLDASRARTGA